MSVSDADATKLEISTLERITAKFVYFRLRKDSYTAEEVAEVRGKCDALAASGRDVYVFFKHEESPEGALCAQKLLL